MHAICYGVRLLACMRIRLVTALVGLLLDVDV